MAGILYGVGVGPGDPELMTLKALNCIKNSEIIILPSKSKAECYAYQIVKEAYPKVEEKEILCMEFPMTKDKTRLWEAHEKIFKEIQSLLKEDRSISFLTIGDPTIYSTYSYIHNRVKKNKGNSILVNGIPSFCAAAAALGITLGENKEEIHLIPGSYDMKTTLKLSGTKIYMKTGKKLKELKSVLEQHGQNFEVMAVSNCGMENQVVSRNSKDISENSGYLTTVIVKEGNASKLV